MNKREKKRRKISKISLFLISLIWIIAVIFTIFLIFNSIKNKKQLSKISSNIPIPDGFYYVGGNIDTGVVISDNKFDEFKGVEYNNITKLKGNQFVWVPVEKAIASNYEDAELCVKKEIFPIAIKEKDSYKALMYVFDTYRKKYIVVNQDDYNVEPNDIKEYVNIDAEELTEEYKIENYQKKFNKMVESVDKNKGFYVSRYEVGNLTKAVKSNEKIVSKAGEDDIAYMDWIDLYKVTQNMYDREDITTEMIWGCQWDLTVLWLAQNNDIRKYVFDSNLVGNYSNIKKKTASSSNYCLNNIFDLAGNVYEWTQRGNKEKSQKAYGGYYGTTSKFYLSDCKFYPITYMWDEVGTRVTMYLN